MRKTGILIAVLIVMMQLIASCESEQRIDSRGQLTRTNYVGSYKDYDIVWVKTTNGEYVYLAINRNSGTASTSYSYMSGKTTRRVPAITIDGVPVSVDSAKAVIEALAKPQ